MKKAAAKSTEATTTEVKRTHFLGNGKQVGKKVQITLRWEDLLSITKNLYKEVEYITLDILPLARTSKFGTTHAVVEHIYIPKTKEAATA